MRRAIAGLALTGAVLAAVPSGAPARAAGVQPVVVTGEVESTITLQNFARDGRCLDATTDRKTVPGSQVSVRDCGSPNQTWQLVKTSELDVYQLRLLADGPPQCAVPEDPAQPDGSAVVLTDCPTAAAQPDQVWSRVRSSATDVYRFRNYGNSDKCLDAEYESLDAPSTRVQVWGCQGGDQLNQFWRALPQAG